LKESAKESLLFENRMRRTFSQGTNIPWAHGIALSDFKTFDAENKKKWAFGSQKHAEKRTFMPFFRFCRRRAKKRARNAEMLFCVQKSARSMSEHAREADLSAVHL
jgi:hypothetical protein